MENLLVDCVTGACCAGFGLVNEVKPMERFEEPDHEAWLLSGSQIAAPAPLWPWCQAGVLPCGLVLLGDKLPQRSELSYS